ncbi:MAG: ATP-binding cassette domain-containing protein [Spirochaetales bacterium]|nr:ATP-binding cassette domain-containing protein [Spirochaetales bacterium]
MVNERIIELKNISKSIKHKLIINDLSHRIDRGSFSGIYGMNGSGKSLLSEIMAGRIEPDSGRIIKKAGGCRVSVVSSSEERRLLEEERRNDDTDFMQGKIDPGRSVRQFIRAGIWTSEIDFDDLASEFEMTNVLDRGLRFLSTGEFRKCLLLRAILEAPDLLILDDPFAGLDLVMRKELRKLIGRIEGAIEAVLIISGRMSDFDGLTSDIRILGDGATIEGRAGKMEVRTAVPDEVSTEPETEPCPAMELVRLEGVCLSYYDLKVLTDINWKIVSGEHWQIRGRNGSGKSSLLSLVNGDNPKAYGQKIDLFGRRRGTGETVWDIKKRIGTVSGTLQQNHRISQSVLSVAVSGFFDSIGLYEKPNLHQLETAEHWCLQFGLKDCLKTSFSDLSEGFKRKVLTVRAVIKKPDLLILDEPCQGLDDYNAAVVLETVELLLEKKHSTLLYVSHDPEHNMKSITNIMDLVPHEDGGYTNRNS